MLTIIICRESALVSLKTKLFSKFLSFYAWDLLYVPDSSLATVTNILSGSARFVCKMRIRFQTEKFYKKVKKLIHKLLNVFFFNSFLNNHFNIRGGRGAFCYCVMGKISFLLSIIVKICLVLAVIGQFTVICYW